MTKTDQDELIHRIVAAAPPVTQTQIATLSRLVHPVPVVKAATPDHPVAVGCAA